MAKRPKTLTLFQVYLDRSHSLAYRSLNSFDADGKL
jgi:hypothetical protein